jgi:anti-sigma factor RsiW
MTCLELEGLLNAVLDGEARAGDRVRVERHLATCADCRRSYAAGQALRHALEEAPRIIVEDRRRDEQLLAILRSEGVCREVSEQAPVDRVQGAVGPQRSRSPWRDLTPGTRRLSWLALRGSLAPALGAMAAAFGVTWGLLHTAEISPVFAPSAPAPSNVAATAPTLDAEVLDLWLARSPTLEGFARLRSAPRPKQPGDLRRGAAPHTGRPVS